MPPWMGPPDDHVGVTVPFIPTVARGADAAVVLAGITAFPDAAVITIQVRTRSPIPVCSTFCMDIMMRNLHPVACASGSTWARRDE